MSGGLAGLSVMWAFNLTQSLGSLVIFSTEAEAKMNAVERILEYSKLPTENLGSSTNSSNKISTVGWPSAGEIVFQKVYFRYRKGLNYALKDLSFTIYGGTRGMI